MMQLTYRFRLYPSRAQEEKMLAMLDQCRWLYNHFLEQLNRKENGKIPSRYELQATLPKLKLERPELKQSTRRSSRWFSTSSILTSVRLLN